jgi:hypothetical protein
LTTKERLIYTAGTFKIDDALAQSRRLIIRSSVLRFPPTTNYANERSNPRKYFLGYATIFINDYVYSIQPIQFEQQIILLWDNLEYQVHARMLCEFANSNTNLVALRTSIPEPGGLVLLPQDPGTFPGCPYTNIKFKLLLGTRLSIFAAWEPMETCEAANPVTTLPSLDPPPPLYPEDQARDEDPPRSLPEEGELPGDTAPATIDDPESDGAVAGSWLLTWSTGIGGTATGTYSGFSGDTFALVSPGSVCSLSGSSDLVRNGSEIIDVSFNCNTSGFVSTLISAVFTPGSSLRIATRRNADIPPGDG